MTSNRWRPWLLLGGLLALHAVVNLVWISRDATLRSFDMGPHIEYASNTLAVVTGEGLRGVWRVARGGEGAQIWPSAGYLPWIALSLIFGHSVAHLRAFTLLFLALLLVAVFLVGRRLRSPSAGLLAAALVSLYPMVFAESRQLGVDLPGAAMAALCLHLLLVTGRWSRPGPALGFGVALGAGILICPRLIFFIWAPGLGSLALALARPGHVSRVRITLNAALAAAAAAAITSPWWFGRLGQILTILQQHKQAAMYRPAEGSLSFYARMLPWGLSPYLLLVALFAAGLLVRRWRLDRPAPRCWLPLLLWPLSGAAALLIMDVHHLRYTLMLAPAVALITAAGLGSIPHRKSRRLIIGLALGVGVVCWLADSFGPRPVNFGWPGTPNLALGDPADRLELASGPPSQNPFVTAARTVGQALQRRHATGRGVVVLQRGDRNTFYVGWRVRPVLSAMLPGITLGEDLAVWEMEDISSWTGSTVPRLVTRPEHCYTLSVAAGKAPAKPADLAYVTITDVPPGAATDLSPAEAARPVVMTLRALKRCPLK